MKEQHLDFIVGRNSVLEALKSGRSINKLFIAPGENKGSIREIISIARERGIVVKEAAPTKLNDMAGGSRHQGVAAAVAPIAYHEVDDILHIASAKGEQPFLLLLDEVEDPHNVGAILRTADAAGVHGVLLPKRRSCQVSSAVAKTSAGAVEYVPVAQIGNVAQTLKQLKKQGLWVAGADMDGTQAYYDADFNLPLVLVIGSEGHGMSRLTRELCDFLVSIPMKGQITSLNASVACALLIYEAMRQRDAAVR